MEFSEAPVTLLYVPATHGIGFTDDQGQYEPIGQTTGVPEAQKKEAGQGEHVRERITLPDSSPTMMTPDAVTAIP